MAVFGIKTFRKSQQEKNKKPEEATPIEHHRHGTVSTRADVNLPSDTADKGRNRDMFDIDIVHRVRDSFGIHHRSHSHELPTHPRQQADAIKIAQNVKPCEEINTFLPLLSSASLQETGFVSPYQRLSFNVCWDTFTISR